MRSSSFAVPPLPVAFLAFFACFALACGSSTPSGPIGYTPLNSAVEMAPEAGADVAAPPASVGVDAGP